MNFDDPKQLSLKGSLILADPSLQDPNFSRSVLLLTEHDSSEGAHGYILNRPLDKRVSDIVDSGEFEGLRDVPVYLGGPVSTGQLTFASLCWEEGQLQFSTHLSTAEAARYREEGGKVRAFVGYSGWGEGQLEAELMQRAWITHKAKSEVIDLPQDEELWGELLRSMGPWYRLLADMPPDPSLN